MSLEDALKANTAAVLAHTAALSALSGAAKAGTTAAASKPAAAAGAKPAAAAKPKVATEDDLRTAAGNYLSVKGAEREVRKANVARINEHFGVGKLTEVPAEAYKQVIDALATFTKGEVPDFLEAAGEEAGEEEALV